MKYCILVTGMPGVGKSDVALRLASHFHVRCFAKDEYKEILFDTIGFKNREEKVKLSIMALDMMYQVAEEEMQKGSLFIFDNGYENVTKDGLMAILAKYDYTAITVRLTGEPGVIYARYIERDLSGKRHRGHVVNDCYPEKHFSLKENPSKKSYEQYVADFEQRGFNDFNANGPLIEADTTDLSKFDFEGIEKQISDILSQAQ